MIDLTIGKPFTLIMKFGIPLFLGSVLQQAYIIIDMIIVGHYLGATELAAIGIAGPIIYLIVSIIIGLAIGFSIIIAQERGASHDEIVKSSIRSMLHLFFVVGTVIFFCSSILTTLFVKRMDLPSELMDNVEIYTRTIFYGIIFQFLLLGIITALRSLGDSITPLYSLFASSIFNIILDIIFIVFFKMGLLGAALATIITQLINLIILLIYVKRTNKYFYKLLSYSKNDFLLIKKGIKLGIFPACQHLLLSGGILILIWIVIPYGTLVIAAATIVGKLESFVIIFFNEIGSSLTTFVAQNIGKNNLRMIKDGVHQTVVFCSIISIFVSVVILIFAKELTSLFTVDNDVITVSIQYIRITYPFFIFLSLTHLFHGFLNGTGKTQVALICTLLAFVVIRLPFSYFLGQKFGEYGLWLAVAIGWVVGLVYTLFMVLHTTKQLQRTIIG